MKRVLGVDLGGTYIKTSGFSSDGARLGHVELPTPNGDAAAVIAAIERSVADLAAAVPGFDPKACAGMGIGVPGTVSLDGREVVYAPNLKWRNVRIVEELERRLGFPVRMDNDANLAALGERWAGAARGVDDFLVVTVGTGIGGGIVVGGRLLRGISNNAAEVGHMVIDAAGPLCGCGRHGCFEALASATALVRRARQRLEGFVPGAGDAPGRVLFDLCGGDPAAIEGRTVFEAANRDCPVAKAAIEATTHFLALGLANLVMIFNPGLVLLTGGITAVGETFVAPVRDRLLARLPETSRRGLTLAVGELGNEAGTFGAARLALEVAEPA